MIILILLNIIFAVGGILLDKYVFPVKNYTVGAIFGIVCFWLLFIGTAVISGALKELAKKRKQNA
jgi:ascorbate-specific PTS system EIIC-type component UlaA